MFVNVLLEAQNRHYKVYNLSKSHHIYNIKEISFNFFMLFIKNQQLSSKLYIPLHNLHFLPQVYHIILNRGLDFLNVTLQFQN